MNNPLVSIITPCYNASEYIKETVTSVLEQTYTNIEYIIVDDGSTDNTLDIINKFKEKIRVVEGEHKGACSARNIGVKKAKGDLFLFLDADDVLSYNTLEILVENSIKYPNMISACLFSRLVKKRVEWVTTNSGLQSNPVNNDFIKGWLTGWYLCPAGVLWPKIVFNKVGGWDESLAANQDGDIMLRALISGVNINLTKDTEVYYRHHNTDKVSISSSKSSRHLKSRVKVLSKVETLLKERNEFDKYKFDVGVLYHKLARNGFFIDAETARECNKKSILLGGSKVIVGTFSHRVLTIIFGLELKEKLVYFVSKLGVKNKTRDKFEKLNEIEKYN